jgi:hypothetical protein
VVALTSQWVTNMAFYYGRHEWDTLYPSPYSACKDGLLDNEIREFEFPNLNITVNEVHYPGTDVYDSMDGISSNINDPQPNLNNFNTCKIPLGATINYSNAISLRAVRPCFIVGPHRIYP